MHSMVKKLLHFLNPMAHLGEKQYSFKFPFITALLVYIIAELVGNLVLKVPDKMGNFIIFTNFALVLYFSFRSAIKGGLTIVVLSVLYYIYFILTRHAPLADKEMAALIAGLLTFTTLVIALIIGWHRQTVDNLIDRETQAKLAAEHEQKRLQILLEQLPVGVVTAKAPSGEIIAANQAMKNIIGKYNGPILSLEDYGKFTAYNRYGKKLKATDWPLAQAIREGKTITNFEVTFIKNSRKRVVLFINAAPITNKRGKILTAVSTVYDITKQKELEQQKDDFIAMASHELRTPLTSAKLYSQILLEEFSNSPKALQFVEKMKDQVTKLTNIVETMLETTQVEKGKMALEEKPFILKNFAMETISDLQSTSDRHMVIDWQTNEYILGNREKIRQVFTNLITNAMKYSPSNSDIRIQSRKKNGLLIVSVQDFGTGITKEEQKLVFDRFYQARHHKTYAGLGLGLYISSEIIKQHGGKMWVESEKGKGSTFYFSLPIYKKKTK